jgi:hypothetical protein
MANADYRHNDRPVDVQLGHRVELDVAVLAADAWAYVDSYIQGTSSTQKDRALFFWRQAERFASNLHGECYEASPPHLYYMMLNATKALLVLRGHAPPTAPPGPGAPPDGFSRHGIAFSPRPQRGGELPGEVQPKRAGVCPLLAKEMGDKLVASYTLEELVSSVVCVHRAYRTIRRTAVEKFIPTLGPFRLKQINGGGRVFFEAWLPKHVAVRSVSGAMPKGLECGTYPARTKKDEPKHYVRQKQRKPATIVATAAPFALWHAKLRRSVHVIASQSGLSYYVCRSDTPPVDLSQLTLNFAVGFALSSLARYHPDILHEILNREDGWVVKEYLCTTPHQFIALISGEITGRIIQRPYSDMR